MKGIWQPIGSALLLATCLPAALGQICSDHPESHIGDAVLTSSGLIEGHAAPRKPAVSEYLGIPYASPPIGDLRFAAPVAYASDGTIQATAYSPDCPANSGKIADYPGFTPQALKIVKGFTQALNTSHSEDCLFLNVWTRPTVTNLKPVLLWFHGGRFTGGGANNPYYDGQALADEHEVVVVTINYRLNIFGFSGAPNLPQNVGLLDQRMAVEWAHRNIAAFGGDPERISIFGQSAGGAAVDYYSHAWADEPLVAGLISHSGTSLSFVPNTAEESADYFFTASKILGCGDKTSDHDEVVKFRPHPPPATPQAVFHPTVDGVTVFSDYASRSAAGQFARLPYLINSNHYEPGYYRISANTANITLSDSAWQAFNDAAFTCPSGASARYRVDNGVPVWQSHYFGDWDNLRLHPNSGSYHGADLPMVFGTAEQVSGIANSDVENEFARYMASAWVAFASDPKEGLTKFGWPQYNPNEQTLVGLAYNNANGSQLLHPSDVEQGCAALNGDSTPGKGAF
ncbi:Carboxylesterase type B [Penicillium paradoxum]|uniref:Carboxylesterase type B n=1 Tax=Penicillium paradoxum TaxID=176176 RepID=UPI0025471FCC|nr:Carboxylesterase type B [Penicillium paradoxum]KAJ5787487.1 Carboxylesterase type B [Penicillium paradoxum]